MAAVTAVAASSLLLVLLSSCWLVKGSGSEEAEARCPKWCSCRADATRFKCGGGTGPVLHSLDPLAAALRPFASIAVSLNLSANAISTVSRSLDLPNLQKLDLSRNKITTIESCSFCNLMNLQRLDLSENLIVVISKDTFEGLINLEKLFLNRNKLSFLPHDSFERLLVLKQLDISENLLKCQCGLLWIVDWSQNANVKLVGNPKCFYTESEDGHIIKKLKLLSESDKCISSALQNALLLNPQNNQIVFEGDSLVLHCKAPFSTVKTVYNLTWFLPSENIDTTYLSISNVDIYEDGLAETILTIEKLSNNHTGEYTCTYSKYNSTNLSKNIQVIVISNSTQYCPTTISNNNKGVYTWPSTIRGNLVSQSCYNKEGSFAYYKCSNDGAWSQLNTSACSYASETTKILEQFALVNLSVVKGSVMGTCQKLHTLLLQNVPPVGNLNDPDEIHFIVKAIKNFLKYSEKEKGLGSVLLDIINTMMLLPQHILVSAENAYASCSTVISLVEDLSQHASNLQGHKKNLAVERFSIKRESFSGMTCVWYSVSHFSSPLENDRNRRLHCSTTNRTITPLLAEQNIVIEASVQIPPSLLYRIDHQTLLAYSNGNVHHSFNLLVTMYEKGSFFTKLPIINNNESNINDKSDNYKREKFKSDIKYSITTPIVGVKLVNVSLNHRLADPIYIMVRDSGITTDNGGRAVLWDEDLKKWVDSSEGCNILRIITNMVVIQCYRLGYVALMQNVGVGIVDGRLGGAKFKFSHPAIYAGSTVLLVCLLIMILTYTICYSAIHMTIKTKHSLINSWLSLIVLCFIYTFGIYQTEDVQLCQSIGILIHYLTLSCLLWMAVAISQLYKNLSKHQSSSLQSTEDESPPDAPIQKPILGIYLVGWGISLIVCGISGAVNMKDYASYTVCFLTNAPALSAAFVPAGIITVFISILFLLIRCTIRNVNGQLSEGTQATENVDLEMWEPSLLVNNTTDRQSEHSTVESEMEDNEHIPIVQLRAHIIVLCIYLTTWICGSVSVYYPFFWYFPYKEDIFSIFYAISASILGVFILFFYGIARSDIRLQWSLMQCYFRKRKKCCRNRSVVDTNIQHVTSSHPLAPISNVAAAQVHSRSNSQNSNRTNSKSNNSNILKAAAELNSHTLCDSLPNTKKISNMNLIVLHRQQYRSNNSVITFPENRENCAEIFYNANQSNVARKFFKKQRKNLKRNCLDIPKRHNFDTDSQISSNVVKSIDSVKGVSNMLSCSSKVNNINIHIERDHLSDSGIKEPRNHGNPNILLESDKDKIHLKRYIIEKDSCRLQQKRDKIPEIKTADGVFMNIYTNSTETGIPQHQIIPSLKEKNHQNGNVIQENKNGQIFEHSKIHSDFKKSCENMPTMRTVSQQCSLEYSSNSEVATPLNPLGSDKTLNTHSEIASLPGTHSIVCSANETSDVDDTLCFNEYYNFNKSGSLGSSLKNLKEHSIKKMKNDNGNVLSRKTINRSLQDLKTKNKKDIKKCFTKKMYPTHDHELEDLLVSRKLKHPDKSKVLQNKTNSFSSINREYEINCEQNYENESDIYFPNYQMSEVSIRSHGLYAPPATSLCVNDLELNFSNSELSKTQNEDYNDENQYANYNPSWRRTKLDSEMSNLRYSPTISCPEVNLLDDNTASLVNEIDELYKQITAKDRRYKKRQFSSHKANDRIIRHCESDSYISESHSDILDCEKKTETVV